VAPNADEAGRAANPAGGVLKRPRNLGDPHGRIAARWGRGSAVLITTILGIALIAASGLAAWLVHQPLVFPSPGSTALLLVDRPLQPTSGPRNTLIGHGIGLTAGYAAVALLGECLRSGYRTHSY
jgi:hypothetical protein